MQGTACTACSSGCTTCSGPLPLDCTQCSDGTQACKEFLEASAEAYFDRKTQTLEVSFPRDFDTRGLVYSLELQSSAQQRFDHFSLLSEARTPRSLRLSLSLRKDILDGVAVVTLSSGMNSTDKKRFLPKGKTLRARPVDFLEGGFYEFLQNKSAQLSATYSYTSSISLFVSPLVGSFCSTMLDRLNNFLEVLLLLNGPRVLYPQLVIKLFLSELIPFSVRNLLGHQETCARSQKLVDAEIHCSILNNMGNTLLVYCGLLFVSCCLFALRYFMQRKQVSRSSWAWLAVSWVNREYGFKYLLMILDAVSLRIFGYALISFRYMGESKQMVGPFVISLSLLLAYAGLYALIAVRARQFARTGVFEEESLLMAFVFEGCKREASRWGLQHKTVVAAANLILQSAVIGLADEGIVQVYCALLVEVLRTVWSFKAAVFQNALDTWLTRLNSCFGCVFLIYQLAAVYASSDEQAVQKQIGLIQACMVLSIVSLNVLYVLVQAVATSIAHLKRCKKNQPASKQIHSGKATPESSKRSSTNLLHKIELMEKKRANELPGQNSTPISRLRKHRLTSSAAKVTPKNISKN